MEGVDHDCDLVEELGTQRRLDGAWLRAVGKPTGMQGD
jgi:hypothetical protein